MKHCTPTRLTMYALLFALAGCGKPDAPTPTPTPAAPAKQAPVAKADGLPELDCPGKADAALGGPDIVGLKLGMARLAALNLARCLNRETVVTFEANWLNGLQTYGIKLAPQAFSTRAGETSECQYRNFSEMQKCGAGNRVWNHLAEEVTVASPGVPGQEKVAAIWRTQNFKAGAMPAAETMLQALVQKYGAPQVRRGQQDQWIQLYWLQDPAGTPLAEGSRGAQSCLGINAQAHQTQQWREDCGLTISAQINLARENPLLVKEMAIGMANQQQLYTLGTRLQHELQELEGRRRMKELDQAKSSGAAVKL
ncbi:MAG: hypothetical protein ABI156_07670 [Caldimonas sp.]